ncbi:MAG: hypothetical protein AB8U72_04185 [Anaplasma ovis]
MNSSQVTMAAHIAAFVVTCSALTSVCASYVVSKYKEQDVDKHLFISLSVHGAILCLLGLCMCFSAQVARASNRANSLLHRGRMNPASLSGCRSSPTSGYVPEAVRIPNLIEMESLGCDGAIRISGMPTEPVSKRNYGVVCLLPEVRCLGDQPISASCNEVVIGDACGIRSASPSSLRG